MADKSAERPNKVKITDIGPSLKKVHIEIPAETVAEQLGTSVDTLMVEAELPGFRKGRVPKRLVERKFGTGIRREAKNALVAQAFQKAVEEHKLRVVGDPTSDTLDKVELVDGKPLSFEIEVETVPEFELPGLDGLEVKKPILEVTDDMVNKEVERLCLNEGRLEPKDQPAAGDYLTGHAVMKSDDDGKVVLDINDAVVQIPTADKNGKGMILGVVVDDFAKQLGTPKIGQSATIKTTGPDNHENEAVRGKAITITFQVKRADQIIPASIDEIARRYGLENADEVSKAVRSRIEQRLAVDQQSAMRSQVARYLMDSTGMELPPRLTANQAVRTLERQRMELMYRGVDAQQIEENIANLRAASHDAATRELKLFFILDRAAEKFDIKITDAELNGRISQMAFSRGERPEKLRQELIARNQIGTVWQQIREHKTMDAILAKAKIQDMGVEEYNKLMSEQNTAHAGATPGSSKSEGEAKESKPKAKGKKKGDAE